MAALLTSFRRFSPIATLLTVSWQIVPVLATSNRSVERPNLIWILTDDQDQVLGGSFPQTESGTPMPKTKQLFEHEGAHATNWYIHTPICSPSRAELLAGRYFHNIKQVGGGGYCNGMHVNFTHAAEISFVRILKEKGYTTGLFGKYANPFPIKQPPGWDAWLANNGGSYMNPEFQAIGIDGHEDGMVKISSDEGNYSTSVIGNYSINWMRKVAKQGKPFFAYIAPKAAHEPFNPAPWYKDYWDPSWPQHEKRGANWNCSAEMRALHHGNIATQGMLSEKASKFTTGVFRNRWRTLMSVDDLIGDLVKFVDEELKAADRTYIMYSSDHGFQLGQFNVPIDKRHVYEWDTKIHLVARGPGIVPGSSFSQPGTNVDIAPTILGLAGIEKPEYMDGKSIVPFLLQDTTRSPATMHMHRKPASRAAASFLQPQQHKQEGKAQFPILLSTVNHLANLGDAEKYRKEWRNEVFIEYYFCNDNTKCMECNGAQGGPYPARDSHCMDIENERDCYCRPDPLRPLEEQDCYATEDAMNNYIALRRVTDEENFLYAEFQEGNQGLEDVDFQNTTFTEHFNLVDDVWQVHNLARLDSLGTLRQQYKDRLQMWLACSGSSCP